MIRTVVIKVKCRLLRLSVRDLKVLNRCTKTHYVHHCITAAYEQLQAYAM
jgi:hypothetical protein